MIACGNLHLAHKKSRSLMNERGSGFFVPRESDLFLVCGGVIELLEIPYKISGENYCFAHKMV